LALKNRGLTKQVIYCAGSLIGLFIVLSMIGLVFR
jgi:hypothetical protein